MAYVLVFRILISFIPVAMRLFLCVCMPTCVRECVWQPVTMKLCICRFSVSMRTHFLVFMCVFVCLIIRVCVYACLRAYALWRQSCVHVRMFVCMLHAYLCMYLCE